LRNAGAPAAPFFAICLHYKIQKEVLQVVKNAFYFFTKFFLNLHNSAKIRKGAMDFR